MGTAAAVPDETHATTHLAVEGELGFFMIDSGCNPVLRIRDAGLNLGRLRGLILTHFHPDHVATVPIFLMDTWLLGRRVPLPIYGLQDVVDRYNIMMDLFRRDEWPGFFDTPCRVVPEKVGALVLEDDDFRITAAPVEHVVPNIGLRIENKNGGGVVAYSSDTAPCDAMVELAREDTTWEFVEVAARPFVTLDADCRDTKDPTQKVLRMIAKHNLDGAVVRVIVRVTPESEARFNEAAVRDALRRANIFFLAAIRKDVEQATRARLGTSPEGLTNEELLERYLISKEVAPVRLEQLMNAAREIFDEVQG